jgi:hypothetical protein
MLDFSPKDIFCVNNYFLGGRFLLLTTKMQTESTSTGEKSGENTFKAPGGLECNKCQQALVLQEQR